jgi:hypothetical protein
MSNTVDDDKPFVPAMHLIEGHRVRIEAELLIAEGYKLLARTSDLDCDPDVRSRRLRDGYLKVAEGHTILAKSNEMIADAIEMRRPSRPIRPPTVDLSEEKTENGKSMQQGE